ncbi:MAG: hypothetical protein POH28_15180 [Acidocella sp.]|nr:hypothetical protein [Acidocella sp.]
MEETMGHSEYDPGVGSQRAWNAGLKLGAKRAFKAQQVWAIRKRPPIAVAQVLGQLVGFRSLRQLTRVAVYRSG